MVLPPKIRNHKPNMLSSWFADSPEYTARTRKDYVPPTVDLNALRAALPNELWERSTVKGLLVTLRVALICATSSALGYCLEQRSSFLFCLTTGRVLGLFAVSVAWIVYWWWQGLVWAGLWSLGTCHLEAHSKTYN